MGSRRPLLLILLAAGCALPPDPGAPRPMAAPEPAAAIPQEPTAAQPWTTLPAETARDRQFAADSAADAAVLDLLAMAEAPGGGDLEEVSFDLDVATWSEHERVRYYLDFFQGPARERMAIWLERLPRYEPYIRAKLQELDLPGDLVYLALIESGYSNTAVSRSRAVGMWQFMLPTGRMYGLRVDSWVDERRDFFKATHAAARYLAELNRQFGSHFLAAAAYNGGPGRVSRGLNRIADGFSDEGNEENGLLSDAAFFQLSETSHIHRETKDYVPKLLAATMIAKAPQRYGFAPVGEVEPFPVDSLVVRDAAGLDVIARLAGTSLATIRELNPQFLRLTTPPGRTSVVRLPAGTMSVVTAGYAALPARERVVGGEHVVRAGETVGGIARRYGLPTQVLLDANPGVGSRGLIRVGQRLRVPGTVTAANAASTATSAGTAPQSHVVARGETLGGIARRYGTTTVNLTRWNNLPSSGLIRVGQRLQVSAAPAPRATTMASTGGAASRVHVVARGETLSAIAMRYRVTVRALQNANNLASANQIRIGQRLRIP